MSCPAKPSTLLIGETLSIGKGSTRVPARLLKAKMMAETGSARYASDEVFVVWLKTHFEVCSVLHQSFTFPHMLLC